MDSNLVDIAAGVVSLIATMLFLRVWQPKRIWRFEDERQEDAAKVHATKWRSATPPGRQPRLGCPLRFSPLVLLWGLPA